MAESWVFSGKNWGWSLRLKKKKRAIVYLTPFENHFLAGFAIGDRAFEAAKKSDLPKSILTMVDEAKKYAEGRGVRIKVEDSATVEGVRKLAAIKMAN